MNILKRKRLGSLTRLLRLSGIITTAFFVVGCEQSTYEDYSFLKTSTTVSDSRVSLHLTGEERREGFRIIKGAPYAAELNFDLPDATENCAITINWVLASNERLAGATLYPPNRRATLSADSGGSHQVSFRQTVDLVLEHYEVSVLFTPEPSCGLGDNQATAKLSLRPNIDKREISVYDLMNWDRKNSEMWTPVIFALSHPPLYGLIVKTYLL